MKNRVNCQDCKHFSPPRFDSVGRKGFLSIANKASCGLGKRVMFRMPQSPINNDWGYIRHCNDFKKEE